MSAILLLWLPLVLSAVFVFIASSIIHMGPFWHRSDYPALPQEAPVLDALRPLALPPGDYVLPRAADMKTYKTSEFMEKLRRGPVLVMTVLPNGPTSMGRNLGQWFVYLLVVSAFVALITGKTQPAGMPYIHIFKLTGATAYMGYALALCQQSIWYGRSWTFTAKGLLDAVIYAAVTAGTFGWLWPH